MGRLRKKEYDAAARRIAELELLGIKTTPTTVARELGLDPVRFRDAFYRSSYRQLVEKYKAIMQQQKERPIVLPSAQEILAKDSENQIISFAKTKIGELIRAFETLVEIRDNGEAKDEVRRKAAVNIIEFFLSLYSRNKTSIEARVRTKLPDELQKEIELVMKKQTENA